MSSVSPPTPPTPPPTPTPTPVDFSPLGPPPGGGDIAGPGDLNHTPGPGELNYTPGSGDLNYTPGPPGPPPPPPQNYSSAAPGSTSAADAAQALEEQANLQETVYRGPNEYPPVETVYRVVQPASAPDSFTGKQETDSYLSPPPLVAADDALSPPPLLSAQAATDPLLGAMAGAAEIAPPPVLGAMTETAVGQLAGGFEAGAAVGTELTTSSVAGALTDIGMVGYAPTAIVPQIAPGVFTGGALAGESAGIGVGALGGETVAVGAGTIFWPVTVAVVTGAAVVAAYKGIPALARAVEADKLSPDYPSAGFPGPVDPFPLVLPGSVGAPVMDPSATTGSTEILPGGTADPQPQVAPGTGGPAMSAAVPQRWREILGYSGGTVDPVTGEPKTVDYVLHVDHIVAQSRILLYLSLEYPWLTPEQMSQIANMEENLQTLDPELNMQKGALSIEEWNELRIRNDRDEEPPLDPDYMLEMQDTEDEIWGLVDERAQILTNGGVWL